MFKKIILAGVLLFIGASVIGALAGGSGSGSSASADTPQVITPWVLGYMQASTFVSGDKQALDNLGFYNVRCRWEGDHVHMRMRLENGMAAHVTAHLQPNYRLQMAGLHGDGAMSQQDAGVDAYATRQVDFDLGHAQGVAGTPTITECVPEINSVELG